jgi:hypothetical protein
MLKMKNGKKAFAALLAAAGWLLAGSCAAMEIRSESAERHDRFTGFPEAPAFNDSAYYGSRKFTGVGWIPGESPARQFALVTPRHMVFANHYRPADGMVIRFLGANGATVDRTVAGSVIVPNSAGATTDLLLVTLSSPLLAADGVTPFPYLNLANDTAYKNTVLTVFGWHVKAGRSTISSIQNLTPTGIGTTRTAKFIYTQAAGNADDVYLETGDSGSPTFAMAGTVPALVGVHLAVGATTTQNLNYDTFIPFYVTQLNALLAADGYQMSPAYATAVTLEVSGETTPVILRQAEAGSCRIDLKNTATTLAGNVNLSLHFAADEGPDSVSGAGWVVDQAGPEVWELHRLNLAAGATARVTAVWGKLPAQPALLVEVVHSSDGSPKQTQTFDLEPAPSYAAWSDGLTAAGTTADPDGDGIANLLEYAFGGDPAAGSAVSAAGGILLPQISRESGQMVLRFPVRTDAAIRGLSYAIEFSETLDGGSWTTATPAGFSTADAAFAPAVSGFALRTVHFDPDVPRRFCRVRIGLNEPAE